jgi:predicted DCC family thiol-disulfide oxidoreductase YuxK
MESHRSALAPLAPPRLRVYYDGLCPLCSREIAYYRIKDRPNLIDWIDITGEGFDAAAEGLDPAARSV